MAVGFYWTEVITDLGVVKEDGIQGAASQLTSALHSNLQLDSMSVKRLPNQNGCMAHPFNTSVNEHTQCKAVENQA